MPFPILNSKERQTISSNIPRVNGRIRSRKVRVIVAATNEQLGILDLQDAIRRARESGLDLVEVAATANPPVCKIIDFGKYRYEQAKQEKDAKRSATRLKEVKFRVKTGEHDYMTKVRNAERFLAKGNKVKVQLQFRGRENAHQELGFGVMERVKNDLVSISSVEMQPRKVGRAINMVLSPLPANKRKRRWTIDSDDSEEEIVDDISEEESEEEEVKD